MNIERFNSNTDDLADNLVFQSHESTDNDIPDLEKESEPILGEPFVRESITPPKPKAKTRKRRLKKDDSENYEGCVHHWKIETPVDGVSHGACKNCNAEKDFTYDKAFGGTWDKISKRKYDNVQRKNRDEKGRFLL